MAERPKWLAAPAEHCYPAAQEYLTLHMGPASARGLVCLLADAPTTAFKAKDVFRASGLSLLGVSNSHVRRDQKRIRRGERLSPILLVRWQGRLVIADGYHRMCAVYSYDEDAEIRCKIVG